MMKKEQIHKILMIIIFAMIINDNLFAQYLSNLSATKESPLYSTYAAHIDRSEFIVDEGYHFRFYESDKGLDLITDNAGNLCLAFKMNGEVVYKENKLNIKPVITTSYSDLLKYTYYPFQNIKVDVFFVVYSSRIAIQDIKITNESESTVDLSVYPFFNYTTDVITNVEINSEVDAFIFQHQEHPDSWTIDHNVPYQENLKNVLLIDSEIDAYGAYSNAGTLNLLNKSVINYCVEYGLVNHSDGSLCTHTPPDAQQIIFLNGSENEILTEDAPKWGDPDPNIPGNGYQSCELGNFQNPPIAEGDSFQVIFTCTATMEKGEGYGIIPSLPAPGGVNLDIFLEPYSSPPIPQNVDATFSQNNTVAVISWTYVPGILYSVYRRTISTPGRYDLLADQINSGGYWDWTVNPDSLYGYVVIAKDDQGNYSGHSLEEGNINYPSTEFFSDIYNDNLSNEIPSGSIKVTAFQKNLTISSGETKSLRVLRGVIEAENNVQTLVDECRNLKAIDLSQFQIQDEEDYSNIPQVNFNNPSKEALYWNAYTMMRQVMLPPEGECNYNYYVFSREPQWGWGHGGQVFHESIAMLAYGKMDIERAINSQRVYIERQQANGYINYRTGPYLNERIFFNGSNTSSAPWFCWQNWELYQLSGDALFLEDAYQSGKNFFNWWKNNRDTDEDGLYEWGGHAVLECVRDGQVAVWDEVGWPSNFETLDLNCLLVKEAKSLALMAQELGYSTEYQEWIDQANSIKEKINQYMWDGETGFYYHVDKDDHDFTFSTTNDLKRKEIIGFLPLFAGVADVDQAVLLLQHMTDVNEFWRDYGVPTLAANDTYYNPHGYWNGPVWTQWQYLLLRGLIDYDYSNEAVQLVNKLSTNMIYQLKTNHTFFELYSPDDLWAGHFKPYIWAGTIARMLLDAQSISSVEDKLEFNAPEEFRLNQNFPNPFNLSTTIKFSLVEPEKVTLKVFDVLGREVKVLLNEEKPAGESTIMFDAENLVSGLYFYTIQSGDFMQTKKMILLK